MSVQVADYLARLEIGKTPSLDRAGLKLLHERHLLLVPFENLDIAAGIPISLQLDDVLEKVVKKRRGGFCYELNGAFAWLLETIGFRVSRLAARVLNVEAGTFSELETDHLCLRVDLDKPYLCDVGFGAAFLHPLDFTLREPQRVAGDVFHLEDVDGDVVYRQMDRATGSVISGYRINGTPRNLSEFSPGCEFHQTSVTSPFTRGVVCTAAIPDGRVTLSRDRLTVTRRDRREEIAITDATQWNQEVRRHFRIDRHDLEIPVAKYPE